MLVVLLHPDGTPVDNGQGAGEVEPDGHAGVAAVGQVEGLEEGAGRGGVDRVADPDHAELGPGRVATHLQAMGRNPVEVVFLYDARTKGRSICSVDVVKGTLLGGASGKSCADLGHEGGGIELLGSAAPRPDPFATP